MSCRITQFLQNFLIAFILVGCSNSDTQVNGNAETNQSLSSTLPVQADPCAIVLIPHNIPAAASANSIDKSIIHYQQAVLRSSHPQHKLERLGWAYVAKARDSRDPGFYTLAELTAACIDRKSENAAESLLLKGHVLHNQHRFREAEQVARRLVVQRGLWFDYALLGDILVERGDLEEAATAYQTAVDQRPGPQAYLRIAHLHWLKGDLDGAIRLMAEAARATSPRMAESAAWVNVRLALLLIQANDLTTADRVISRALTLKPDYPPALHVRGRLLLAQGKPQEAIPALELAVEKDPLPEFRWTLYEALIQAGLHDAAGLQKSAILQNGAVEDRRTFALFLATTGENPDLVLDLALQELESRQDVFTLDTVAWALHGVGKNSEALDYSMRALSEGTQDARLHLHAGVIAARTGDAAQALKLFAAAKAMKNMLLPSERQHLATEFAALSPRISTPASGQTAAGIISRY